MLDVEETERLKHEHQTQAIGLVDVHPYRRWIDFEKSWYLRTTIHEPFHTRSYSTLTVNPAMIVTIGDPHEHKVLLSAENVPQEETTADATPAN